MSRMLQFAQGNSFSLAFSLDVLMFTRGGTSVKEDYAPSQDFHVYIVNGYPTVPKHIDRPLPAPIPPIHDDRIPPAEGCFPDVPFFPGEEDCLEPSPFPKSHPHPFNPDCSLLPEVSCGGGPMRPRRYEVKDFSFDDNVVTINMPGTLPLGIYHVELVDKYHGKDVRGVVDKCFEVVESCFEQAGGEGYDYTTFYLGSVTFLGQDAPTRKEWDEYKQSVSEDLAELNERIDEIVTTNVQSDWAENDPTSPAYIRNRTHFVRGREAEWNGIVSLSGHYGTSEGDAGIVIGRRYDVDINVGGVTYSYTAMLPKTDDEGNYYLSENWDITTSPQRPTADDSFYIWNIGNTIYFGFAYLQNVEVEVTLYDSDVKRLDRQFMPDGVAWEVTEADIEEITGKQV